MISQTAEYALRAFVYLANQHGRAQTTQQIAEATDVPVGYLAKVMQNLCRAGLIRSRRGLHGGFTLQKQPEEISILDVLQIVDPLRRIDSCPLNRPEHKGVLCPLHRRLDTAAAAVEAMFEDTMINTLLEGSPLCGLPCIEETVSPVETPSDS
jgi:Rrf2 family protein